MHADIRDLMDRDPRPGMGDPFGESMSLFFGIVRVLDRADADIPFAWQYRAGWGSDNDPDPDEDREAFDLEQSIREGRVTLADVRRAGDVLHRYVRCLERAGMAY